MTRALLLAALAAVLLAATAHAQQCQCPAPPELPVVARVWLVWVQGGAK